MRVTLNVDLGEAPGEPDELYALADQANVACGGHAGDPDSIERACRLALAAGARVAAHPSYPDREHFGRRSLALPPDDLARSLRAQCAALAAAARRLGLAAAAVKPHGALYHDAATSPALAALVVRACREGLGLPPGAPLAYVGPPAAEPAAPPDAPLAYLAEGFADRAYEPDGSLRPRSAPGALLTDPAACAEQALALARSGRFRTLCVHGDTPGAVAIARAVRRALAEQGLLEARG
ncbi:MAG TPA: LamB/YcsF family protein [Polyangiaceae bacterium]|nr:LamB/YcsF family protein [Polyangiaceae bacterium]